MPREGPGTRRPPNSQHVQPFPGEAQQLGPACDLLEQRAAGAVLPGSPGDAPLCVLCSDQADFVGEGLSKAPEARVGRCWPRVGVTPRIPSTGRNLHWQLASIP